MYGGLIGTHQRSFEWYHPDPLWPPLPRNWGLQLSYPLLSQEQVKLRTSNLAGTSTGPILIKAYLNFWRKGRVGISRDCTIFLCTPYYLKNGLRYGLQIWQVHLQGQSE